MVRNLPANKRYKRLELDPGSGIPVEKEMQRLQYSCLENPYGLGSLVGYSP